MDRIERQRIFWRRLGRITWSLVGVWFVISFIGPWFARDLEGLSLGSFPLSFWMAAQGALVMYVAIIAVYAWAMERLEERHEQPPEEPPSD